MPRDRTRGSATATSEVVSNSRIAGVLFELADVLEVSGVDSFRVRAYRSAARQIENYGQPVCELAAGEGIPALKKIPSIGDSMAKKILEICRTGTLEALTQARQETPYELTDLLGIEGLGPKKLHILHAQLGVQNLDDLERRLQQGEVAALAGFGKKTEAKLLHSIEFFRRRLGRCRRADIEPIALALRDSLAQLKTIERVEIAGSFRRGKDTIGDLDILCATRDPAAVMTSITAFPELAEVIVSGPTKTSVRLDNGLQVDVRAVEPAAFGAALHYFTGSKEHNVVVRSIAKDAGLKVNEYGVFRGDERIAGATEEEIFGALDLEYVRPELREDRGEFEAARSSTLPEALEVEDILGDLQMHSTASDGKNSVEEMARAAKEVGRTYIAITDHSKAVTVANGLDDERMRAHADAIRRVKVPGIRVLASVEVDIMKDGTLDLESTTLRDLDLVVASVHSHMSLPAAEQTSRILRAVESGLIHILAHPTGRLLQQREPFPFDVQAVIKACVRHRVALEINAHPARLDLDDVNARMARDLGAQLVISTDAHRAEDLALMRFGVTVARRAWLTREHVLNTRPVEEFLEWFRVDD